MYIKLGCTVFAVTTTYITFIFVYMFQYLHFDPADSCSLNNVSMEMQTEKHFSIEADSLSCGASANQVCIATSER